MISEGAGDSHSCAVRRGASDILQKSGRLLRRCAVLCRSSQDVARQRNDQVTRQRRFSGHGAGKLQEYNL